MTDAVAVFSPGFRVTDSAGTASPGATIEFYEAGTDTPKSVYSDKDLTTDLGTTVYTDAGGYPVTAYGGSTRTLVYVGSDPYKIVIKTSAGVTLATHDLVMGAVVGGGGGGEEASGITQAQADARYIRNVNALASETALDDADLLPFWDTADSANNGITWANVKANLVAEAVVFDSGVKTVFYQSAAPTGWTKDTTAALNNTAIRLVTGTGGVTGGTANFTTVFAARTILYTNLPSVTWPDTLSVSTALTNGTVVGRGNGGAGGSGSSGFLVNGFDTVSATSTVGGSVTSGGGGTAMDFAVKYADMIVCTKD